MGTVFSLDVRDEVRAGTVDAVVALLHRLDAVFSTYRPDSEVSRLRRGEVALADCDLEVRAAAELCGRASALTQGFFDAGSGPSFDPSGVVKGWAVQRAAGLLLDGGSLRHCVNGGGDVAVGQGPSPDRRWGVGIVDPFDRGAVLATVGVERGGVATSGTAERGGHVVDPTTGAPATGLVSASVVGPSLLWADVYATAALAAGPDRAPGVLAAARDVEWLLVRDDGSQLTSPGWAALTV